MRVFLTGGTGFLGTPLVRALVVRGDDCVVISRSGADPWQHPRAEVIQGHPTSPGPWQARLSGVDVVINLAGERIVAPPRRWTTAHKRRLRESRLNTTRNLVAAIREASPRPATLISSSAIGYYGHRGDELLDESASHGTGFLAELARDWENAATEAQDLVRVVCLRGGIALGADGGALELMLPLFKLGLGGPWGHGKQWWSWIHVADDIGLMLHVIDHELSGPINLTAPNPVTVNEFAQALGAALRRPALLRAPAFALRLALGEVGGALLESQRVVPRRAGDTGYQFRFPTLAAALADLCR